jgi:hypothetical protein
MSYIIDIVHSAAITVVLDCRTNIAFIEWHSFLHRTIQRPITKSSNACDAILFSLGKLHTLGMRANGYDEF